MRRVVLFTARQKLLPLLYLLAVSCAGGCTSVREYVHNGLKVGPNYKRPAAPVADEWIDSQSSRISSEPGDYSAWWTVFNDPVLDRLVETAYAQNITLREAGSPRQNGEVLVGAGAVASTGPTGHGTLPHGRSRTKRRRDRRDA